MHSRDEDIWRVQECSGHRSALLAFVLLGCVFKIQSLWSLSGPMLSPDGGESERGIKAPT